MVNLMDVITYANYRALNKPVEFNNLLVYGYFPYRVVTLWGDNVESCERAEYDELENHLESVCPEFHKQNKYIIVTDKKCIYLHDAHGRTGGSDDIRDYDFRDTKPRRANEDHGEFLARVPEQTLKNYRKARGFG